MKKKKRYQGIGLEHRIMKLEGCCAAGRESGGLVRKELRLGLQKRRKSIVYESRFAAHGFLSLIRKLLAPHRLSGVVDEIVSDDFGE